MGCMAHARRKFHELNQSGKSQIAEPALTLIQVLYAIEAQAKSLASEERQRLRQEQARPLADALYAWMLAHREKVSDNSGTSRALD